MKYPFIHLLSFLIGISLLSSCMDIADKKTTVAIEDNNRHYFPILAGQKKDLAFSITNTGNNPLLVTEIITSCGCLDVNDDDALFSIPPGKERALTLTYNSAKNIGYVQHYITLYGNFATGNAEEIVFDIHVVPNNLYTKDYEELHQEQSKKRGGIRNLVDGNENARGYFTDEDLASDP